MDISDIAAIVPITPNDTMAALKELFSSGLIDMNKLKIEKQEVFCSIAIKLLKICRNRLMKTQTPGESPVKMLGLVTLSFQAHFQKMRGQGLMD